MSSIAIIGAGPAGLMAAERLANAGYTVTIYDSMPSPGRKFLLAGRGGLNLTHSEPLSNFLPRYRAAQSHLAPIINAFTPADLRAWAAALGQETYVGSSGRVFPSAFKASPLLRAWLKRLADSGVTLKAGHRWCGIGSNGAMLFRHGDSEMDVASDAVVLALGGASWPRLGSTGAWVDLLAARGVAIAPLRPSNCGFHIRWSSHVTDRHAGEPLKRIALSFGPDLIRGEAMITAEGLEGGAVYALSAPVRDALLQARLVTVHLDLRPDMTVADLSKRLATGRSSDSLSNRLRKLVQLSPAAIAVLRDAVPDLARRDAGGIAAAIKDVSLVITGQRPLDRAISSAGGVLWSELDAQLMLKRLPGVFCAGEMIDWEAPTGGYLLQACFATGVAAADGVQRWLTNRSR